MKVDRKVEKVAQSSRYQSVSYQSAIGRFPDVVQYRHSSLKVPKNPPRQTNTRCMPAVGDV